MPSRYSRTIHIQPTRKLTPAPTDIPHTFQRFETIDQLAFKYYKDATLGWIVMAANPEYFHEFEVPAGAKLRIPFPLSRVWSELGVKEEI